MILKVECKECHTIHEIAMTEDQAHRVHIHEEFIQDILPAPKYTAEQRELFISGLCYACWDEMVAYDDDEDEEIPVQSLDQEIVNELLMDEHDYPFYIDPEDTLKFEGFD